MTGPDATDLVTAEVATSEFQAHARAARLLDEGIEAVVVGPGGIWPGSTTRAAPEGAAILVPGADLEHARQVLGKIVADSADLDWDQVDVGERADSLPLTPVGHTPILARIAVIVVALVIVVSLGLLFVRLILG